MKKIYSFVLALLIFSLPLALMSVTAHAQTDQGSGGGQTGQGSSGGQTGQGTSGGQTDQGTSGTASGCTGNTCLVNPLKAASLTDLLDIVLKAVVSLGTIFLTIMLIFVGFKFVLAQGNEEKLRDARNALMWTVIGGLLLLGATGIEKVIGGTINGLTS